MTWRFAEPTLPLVLACGFLAGCSQVPIRKVEAAEKAPDASSAAPVPAAAASLPLVRATGTVRAEKVFTVMVPQLQGQGGRMTLVRLAPNGTQVKEGDLLAEFDRTKQLDDALEAKAKFEDLGHQVDQKRAQNNSDLQKRIADVKQAEADLEKALIQLKKGPILSEIDRLKAETRAASAKVRVESLQKSSALREKAEAAGLRILQLQQDRQKVALERAESNAAKLILRAPLSGMVALDNIWRGGSMGHAQEGDQLWNGQPLLKIFDPSSMLVQVTVNEADGAVLASGTRAQVRLDAYPEVLFEAEFLHASPVASSALGSPIRNFNAMFKLTRTDPRLLPDLSAQVTILPPGTATRSSQP